MLDLVRLLQLSCTTKYTITLLSAIKGAKSNVTHWFHSFVLLNSLWNFMQFFEVVYFVQNDTKVSPLL